MTWLRRHLQSTLVDRQLAGKGGGGVSGEKSFLFRERGEWGSPLPREKHQTIVEGEEEEALMEDRGRPEGGGGQPTLSREKSQSHSEKIRKTERVRAYY